MDTKTRDVEAILADFRQCLNTYDAWAESFWRFSALELEQVFKVGDEVALMAPMSSKAPSSTVAMCKASGTLTLVHLFESTRFVPIGNTPVMLQAIPADGGPLGEPIYKTIGPSGILEVTECTRDQLYRITFYPNVSRDHVKALYASYQSILAPLESQLRKDWTDTFEPLWQEYREANFVQRYRLLDQGYANGFGHALHELWDNIEHLYQWLADLRPNSEKLLQYLAQTELDALLELSQDAIANGLLVLSDEPLLFIYLAAMVSWMRMLPPPYLNELLGQITAEVLINLLLVWVTAGMGVTVRLGAQVLGKVKSGRVRQWLEQMARPFADTRLDRHAEALRPLLLGSPATPIKTVPSVPLKAGAMEVTNPVPLVREKSAPKTTLVKHQAVDDAPSSAKNPNGQASASADNTATHGCPVSMVTGEELLTLTDGELDGVLPFAWTRLYRTSAVEVDCGLGFGWSHALAQHLCVVGGSVVWTDHENRSTTFPLPSTARPAISNSLAEAAIYLGAASDELVLAQGARFYHFHDGVLTAISDAYDNRLRISRDGLGRILRLDNGAGRALLLRYDRGHIVAVDYQVFRVDSEADDAWVTEQNLVAYRYDEEWRLLEATNAIGESERYQYDSLSVITERQLAGGASFFWAWERSGKAARCVRHWASFAQMDTRYAWDDNGSVTLLHADGSQEVYVHDPQARLVQRVDPDGGKHFKSYDAQGRLTVEQDPLGAITAYQYDEAGRLVALFPGDDEPTSYEHEHGFVRVMRRGEAVWKYQRNEQGAITRQTDPDGNLTEYSYDKRGQ
ncbi:RHS repeat protein, partial [Pseudomonas gessardii]|nr:RHS repeat protein [Pseudomonas gessardii]